MGAGLVAGVVIGCVVAVALIAAAVYYAFRWRKSGPNLCAGIFFDKTDFEAACGAGANDLNAVVLGEQPTPPCVQGRASSAGKLGAGCEQADEHFSTPVTCDVAASAAGAGSPFAPSPSVPPAAPPAPASTEPPRKALPAACDADAADAAPASHCVVMHATSAPATAAVPPPEMVNLDTTEAAETTSSSAGCSSRHTPPLGVPAAATAAAAAAPRHVATPLSPSIPAVPDLRVPARVTEAAAAEAAAPPVLATGLRPPSASAAAAAASAATAPTGFTHHERHNHESLRQLEREIFPAEQRAPETFRCVEIVDSAAEGAAAAPPAAAAAGSAPGRHLPPPLAASAATASSTAELLGSLPAAAGASSSAGPATHTLPVTRQRTPGSGTPTARREVPTFNLSVAMGSAGVHLQSRPMGAAAAAAVTPVLRDPEGTPMFAGGGYPAAPPPAGASHQPSALPPLHGGGAGATVTTPRAFAAQRQATAFRADGSSTLGGVPAASALSASGSLRGKEGSVGSGLSARFAGSVVLPGGAGSAGGLHPQHGGRHSAVPPAATSSQGGLAPVQGGGQGTVVRKRAASLLAHLAKDSVPTSAQLAAHQSFSKGSAIENIHVVPPPVVTAEGAIMRTAAPGMGSVLKKNPFYFCLLMEEWERRCGLDGGPLPSPVMHRIPDDGGRVCEEDWALLDEANRLREGGDSTYWSVFLNEVERLQHNRR